MVPSPNFDSRSLTRKVVDLFAKREACYKVSGIIDVSLLRWEATKETALLSAPETLERLALLFAVACAHNPWIMKPSWEDYKPTVIQERKSVKFIDYDPTSIPVRQPGYQIVIEPTHELSAGQLHAYEKHLLAIVEMFVKTIESIGVLENSLPFCLAVVRTEKRIH